MSQCGADYRRCDTPTELVRNVGSGDSVRFVKGTTDVVESSIAAHGPRVPVGGGPDETEIEATSESFRIVGHSRTGRDFVIRGSGRDPEGWARSWEP